MSLRSLHRLHRSDVQDLHPCLAQAHARPARRRRCHRRFIGRAHPGVCRARAYPDRRAASRGAAGGLMRPDTRGPSSIACDRQRPGPPRRPACCMQCWAGSGLGHTIIVTAWTAAYGHRCTPRPAAQRVRSATAGTTTPSSLLHAVLGGKRAWPHNHRDGMDCRLRTPLYATAGRAAGSIAAASLPRRSWAPRSRRAGHSSSAGNRPAGGRPAAPAEWGAAPHASRT